MSRFSPVVFRVDERCFFRSAEKACERGAMQDACGCSRFLSHRQSYRRGGSKSGRGRIDTYTKRDSTRLAETASRAKKTGNTTTEYRITADRACFFYHFVAFRSREQRKASNESEKELFYSVKYRHRDRAAAFFLAMEEASEKRGERTTSGCVFDKFACK